MKKYLAMILAAVCLFACISTTAFADDASAQQHSQMIRL